MSKPVILTGIRANNDLTIGNYFGAILPIIDMAKTRSDEYQVNLFIPDLHSFTTPIDHSLLYDQILHNARLFVAAGLPLDNPDIYLYRQSYISAHSELTWILDCFTSFGEMDKMTQFKDKSGRQSLKDEFNDIVKTLSENHDHWKDPNTTKDELLDTLDIMFGSMDAYNNALAREASVGLFNYPVLMAADILLYNARYIPVGEDQTQHLEFARDISERINKRFGDIFTIPDAVQAQHKFFNKEQGLRIMDLVDPTKKMSKSDDSGRGVIFLGDKPSDAFDKIIRATTDSMGEIRYDKKNQPGISNLLEILALLKGTDPESVIPTNDADKSYGAFKIIVAGAVSEFLTNFQEKLSTVDDTAILAKIKESEEVLRPVANATLLRAQQAVGLRRKA